MQHCPSQVCVTRFAYVRFINSRTAIEAPFDSGVTRLGGRRGGFGPLGTGLGEGESGGGICFGFTGRGRDGAGVPGLTGCGTLAGRRSGIFSGISIGS